MSDNESVKGKYPGQLGENINAENMDDVSSANAEVQQLEMPKSPETTFRTQDEEDEDEDGTSYLSNVLPDSDPIFVIPPALTNLNAQCDSEEEINMPTTPVSQTCMCEPFCYHPITNDPLFRASQNLALFNQPVFDIDQLVDDVEGEQLNFGVARDSEQQVDKNPTVDIEADAAELVAEFASGKMQEHSSEPMHGMRTPPNTVCQQSNSPEPFYQEDLEDHEEGELSPKVRVVEKSNPQVRCVRKNIKTWSPSDNMMSPCTERLNRAFRQVYERKRVKPTSRLLLKDDDNDAEVGKEAKGDAEELDKSVGEADLGVGTDEAVG